MAAPHVFVVYSIKDAKGKISITKVNFPDSADIAIVKIFARSTAEFINNIIKGQIVDIGIGLSVDMSGLTLRAAPDPDSDVEEGARFTWRAATGALTNFRLPTFDEAFLVSGTKNVDTADAAVDTFVDRIIEGHTEGLINVSPSDDRGSDIVSLDAARESFTASRG